MRLNLETKNKEQEVLKEYLENNVSYTLADKINNGVKIQKDDKTLLNKKDLDGFIQYATEEARKQVEKNARCACVKDEVVFGWAIHYFEEDSIEGNLYNEDGTEYKPNTNLQPKTFIQRQDVEPKQVKPKQASLFDFLVDNGQDNEDDKKETLSYKGQLAKYSQPDLLDCEDEENDDEYDQDEELFGDSDLQKIEKNDEKITKNEENLIKNSDFLQKNQIIDYETGEIISSNETNFIDKDICESLAVLLENKIKVE